MAVVHNSSRVLKAIIVKILKQPIEFLKSLLRSGFRFKVVMSILGVLGFFYYRYRQQLVEKIYKPTEFNKRAVKLLEDCLRSYRPTFFLPTAFSQIVWANLTEKRYVIKYEAQNMTLPDGEELTVEWFPANYASMDPETPIIAFILGICGSSVEGYCKVLSHMVREKGWRLAIINRRGFAGQKLKKGQFMHKNEDEDVHSALMMINEIFEKASIYLVGVSAGANWSARYLGINKKNTCIDACSIISNPFNVGRISFSMNQSFLGDFFSKHMAKGLKTIMMSHFSSPQFENELKNHYQDMDICLKEIKNRKTCWEFDEFFSTKFCGELIRSRKRL
jgi:predicted alpha/beta-fold hydrolase